MAYFRQLALAAAVSSAFVLAGCGGSNSSGTSTGGGSDGDGSGGNDGSEVTTLSGTAEAPAGAVASLEPLSPLEIAMSFLISPVAAAITGLEPVGGAQVELIRVNNAGEQQGDVLATATTSITGTYSLQIPEGTSLAGDLVVRIQGSNTEMRAQAVDDDVDINPISEYVLQKFIQRGTELSSLTTSSVVQLRGRAEEFDIAATSDLSSMIDALEAELGDFVDAQVTKITSAAGDVTEIAGDWRGSAILFGLRDSDGQGFGALAAETYDDNFGFSNGGNGVVNLTFSEGGFGSAYLSGVNLANASLFYQVSLPGSDVETLTASYLDGGIMTLDLPFDEFIDDDQGSREPPRTLQFQKAAGNNVMFMTDADPKALYRAVDTSGDGNPDALDPNHKIGDELLISLEAFVKKPTNATAGGLAGQFGRVYLGTYFENNVYEVENERNVITFNENSTLDVGDEEYLSLSRVFNGSTTETDFLEQLAAGETGLPFTLQADGSIVSVGGEPANIQVDDALNLIVSNDFEGELGNFAFISKTVMVRLPEGGAPDLSGRTYRIQSLALRMFENAGLGIQRSRFDSTMSFDDSGSAQVELGVQAALKLTGGLGGDIEVTRDRYEISSPEVTVNANGSATIILDLEGSAQFIADGFFNQNGSIGVFRTRYDEDGDGTAFEPSELGMMILAELP